MMDGEAKWAHIYNGTQTKKLLRPSDKWRGQLHCIEVNHQWFPRFSVQQGFRAIDASHQVLPQGPPVILMQFMQAPCTLKMGTHRWLSLTVKPNRWLEVMLSRYKCPPNASWLPCRHRGTQRKCSMSSKPISMPHPSAQAKETAQAQTVLGFHSGNRQWKEGAGMTHGRCALTRQAKTLQSATNLLYPVFTYWLPLLVWLLWNPLCSWKEKQIRPLI